MNIMNKNPTFGLIVGTRGFYNPQLAQAGRKDLITKMENLGFDYVILPETATPSGAVETLADAKKCAALYKEKQDQIDGVVVVLPNFGSELGIVLTLEMAKLNVPVLVQACGDDLNKVSASEKRDAFCGKFSVCNNLYQHNIPFTNTSQHTCKINSEVFTKDLEFFADVCRTVNGLGNARIGTIGARPATFQTFRFNEKIFQESGITIVPVDLSEIIFAANKLDNNAKLVKDKLAEINAYGKIPDRITEENILKQARLSVVIENWMAANECVASTVQCWTSILENYGCAACLSMSMLGEKLLPSACEVDVAGAVSMYALLLASGNNPGLLDWNNNYGDDRDKCINTHCSNFPKTFMGREVEISELDILGEILGKENCFGAVKGNVAAGPMTFFRITTDDGLGKIKSYLGEGEFTDDPCTMDGGIAVCKINNLRTLLGYICKNGFGHHVAMARSNCANVIYEAVTNYLGWDIYYHKQE